MLSPRLQVANLRGFPVSVGCASPPFPWESITYCNSFEWLQAASGRGEEINVCMDTAEQTHAERVRVERRLWFMTILDSSWNETNWWEWAFLPLLFSCTPAFPQPALPSHYCLPSPRVLHSPRLSAYTSVLPFITSPLSPFSVSTECSSWSSIIRFFSLL